VYGETAPLNELSLQVVNTCAVAICTGQRFKEVKKYSEEKRKK
jgi:hypothetical protein